jgi:hypothetical protein
MDARSWWLLANFITIALTFAVCVLMIIQIDQARRRLDIPGQPDDVRAWYAWDIDYLRTKIAVNSAVCVMGLLMVAVALEWDQHAPVPLFIPVGTIGFGAIWVLNAYSEFRSWWRAHLVAEISARLALERDEAGC